jgi:hypothetical protein
VVEVGTHALDAIRIDVISSVGGPITERGGRHVPDVLKQWCKVAGVCRKREQRSYGAGWSRNDARWRTLMGALMFEDVDDPPRPALPEDRRILRRSVSVATMI